MIQADRGKFLEIVIGFAELKGKSLSAPALELFWNAMQDWRIEDFQAAANQLIKSCPWMPTPKEFEDLRKKAGRLSAGEAWADVLCLVRSGAYRAGGLSLLIDAAVAALGGYQAIAMHDEAALHFLERRFAEHFAALEDRADIREALPAIAFNPVSGKSTAGLKRLSGPQ